MAETINLKNVLAAASEAASLGTDTRLLAVDSSGTPKRVAQETLLKSGRRISAKAESARWLRIANGSRAVMDTDFLLLVHNGYMHDAPVCMLLHGYIPFSNFEVAYCGTVSLLRKPANTEQCVTKLRMVRTADDTYLDLYYPHPDPNMMYVESLTSGLTLLDTFGEAAVPEGASVKEFDLTKSGGVISCTSFRKGGGLRDGGDNESIGFAENGFPCWCGRSDKSSLRRFKWYSETDSSSLVPSDTEEYNGLERDREHQHREMRIRGPEFAVHRNQRNVLHIACARHRMGLSDGDSHLRMSDACEKSGRRYVVRMEDGAVHVIAIRKKRKEVSHV